jgi:hypothetical protein
VWAIGKAPAFDGPLILNANRQLRRRLPSPHDPESAANCSAI